MTAATMRMLARFKQHDKVYESFFVENNLVVSAPLLLSRLGDGHDDQRSVSIKEKLPLRVFAGASPTADGRVSFGRLACYNNLKGAFEEREADNYAPYMHALKEAVGERMPDEKGVRFEFLLEAPRTFGLSFEPSLCAALASVCRLADGKKDEERLASVKEMELNDFVKDDTLAASLCEAVTGRPHAFSLASACVDSAYPTVSALLDS